MMATPAFRCIRQHWPAARIVLVIWDTVAPVLHGADWFDRVILYRAGRDLFADAGELMHRVREVRRERCELGLILPNSFSSALMLWLAGVERRVGYARDARSVLLTDAVPCPSEGGRFQPTYMVDYYLALCRAAGAQPQDRRTQLPCREQNMAAARDILARAGIELRRPLFLLHPGAAFGPSKLWLKERWAALAEALHEESGAQVACVGVPEDGPLVRRIAGMCRMPLADLTKCGIDLHLLKGVVRLSQLLVTTDSGPRHYGVALGVPTVCLMGSTHPGYSTSGLPHDWVVRVDVECGPCQRKVCRRDHRCMELLTTDMALRACRQVLQAAQG